jgi:hypothetical protein
MMKNWLHTPDQSQHEILSVLSKAQNLSCIVQGLNPGMNYIAEISAHFFREFEY